MAKDPQTPALTPPQGQRQPHRASATGAEPALLESPEDGAPDGLKTDESGNVYCTGPEGVWVFNPKGEHLGTIVTPELPANCCWGAGFRGLYITARTSVYHVPTKVPGTRTF